MTVERLRASLAERYTLESELGQGGMATVYLARDLKHDRQVAVKVLRPELAAILGRERFLAEVRNTARLDHPHILTLLDSGESDGFVWYTLPYIRGESLRHKLDRETQLGVDEAVSITRQIAGALEHAHQHGIIHRDVKPENILLHEGEAMLADFGIALAVKEAGGQRLTETGLSIGTPQYMSPEQATAARNLDARSDVYSLGAVLYEMLAGEPPFTGATGQAVIAKLLVERPTSLRTVRDTVPAGLEAVVVRALAKVPADRFPSAAAFAEALAAPETHRASKPLPKRALLLGGAAAVLLVLAGLWLAKKSGPSGKTLAVRGMPEPSRVTFSGNALEPALSPDGKQLAYLVRTCPEADACTLAVMVEDPSLGERKKLAEGFSRVAGLDWSPDQRFLVFHGWRPDQEDPGSYLLSLFTGTEQFLGEGVWAPRFLASADTILAVAANSSVLDKPSTWGSTRWLLLMSRTGSRLDSIPFVLRGITPWLFPSPDGRRILIWVFGSDAPSGQGLYLIDRAGRLTDSLPIPPGFHGNMGAVWTASGDGILLLTPADSAGRRGVPALQNEQARWALLRFPVSPDGRVRSSPDTVTGELRLPGAPTIGGQTALSSPSRSGAHALALTSVSFSLSTVERPSFTAPPARKAKLITGAAGRFGARISPDGERMLVLRQVMLDDQPATQLEIMPFAGGSATPLGPSRKGVRHATWSADGKTVYVLARGTPGQLEQVALDAASGRSRWSRTVPDSLDWKTWLMPDSLLIYLSVGSGSNGTPKEWRSYPWAGEAPLVFSFPDTAAWMNASTITADGKGSWLVALITSSEGTVGEQDTFALQVARPGAPAERVSVFTGLWLDLTFLHAEPGTVFEVVGDLMSGGKRRLLLEPGRPPRDLGPMPIPMWPQFSADGRRGVLTEIESQQTDIWLLKWPGGDSTGTK